MTTDLSELRTLPSTISPEKVRQQAIELFEQGYGYKATAGLLGLPVSRVRDWLRRYKKGLFKAEAPSRLYRYNDTVRVKALELAEEGLSFVQIAAQMGIPVGTVRKLINDARKMRPSSQ